MCFPLWHWHKGWVWLLRNISKGKSSPPIWPWYIYMVLVHYFTFLLIRPRWIQPQPISGKNPLLLLVMKGLIKICLMKHFLTCLYIYMGEGMNHGSSREYNEKPNLGWVLEKQEAGITVSLCHWTDLARGWKLAVKFSLLY